MEANSHTSGEIHEERIADAASMETGDMRMARVGERRVAIIRTASGFHALDNACPHEGYGLVTGGLDGELVTCQWHNWKFDVRTGKCVMGEEDVACHQTRLVGGDLIVTVETPTDEQRREALWPSLRRGIERQYPGQIARDVARLLQTGATPDEIIAEGLQIGLPRTEWGMGHEMAVAADLLDLTDHRTGLDRTLPLVHALAGLAETTRDRPVRERPDSTHGATGRDAFLAGIENEDWSAAVHAIRAARTADEPIESLRSWFIHAASAHHLSYGHGAIYVQKAFRLIERLPELTDLLLEELALVLIYSTREDTLPYMRKTMRAIADLDLVALAEAAGDDWSETSDEAQAMFRALVESDEPPVAALVRAAHDSAGVMGVINAVTVAGSHQLLALDVAVDLAAETGYGWLDLTHVVTYANAARWAWRVDPGPHTARLALFTAFQAWDATGRGRLRDALHFGPLPGGNSGDVYAEVVAGEAAAAVESALGSDRATTAGHLEQASLDISAGSFIVSAHLTKLAVAAREEADALDSNLPLAATARFLASPRRERFVAAAVANAVGFVETGQPPRR